MTKKKRVRVVCEGKLPVFNPNGEVRPSQLDVGVRPLNNNAGGPKVGTKKKVTKSVDGPKKKVTTSVDGPIQSTRSKNKANTVKESLNTSGLASEDSPIKNKGGRGNKPEKNAFTCPWTLHVSKLYGCETWMVKTLIEAHNCLQSRTNKHFTHKFLGNPDIPSAALQGELQRKFALGLSQQKAQRAKRCAKGQLRGDYTRQYNMLREYLQELQTQNPGTTVHIEVEPPMDPDSNERVFRRVYVCLGAIKRGFRSAGRELLGVDGAFMSGPFPGQVLTAVSIDSNNGIYPVAYAIVESEITSSWTWFLECLGDDLEIDGRSNYTFVTDRQKGIIQAIAKVFPCAQHRYCLKHIHENMKQQWRGTAYKNHLWRCAIANIVQEFNKCMLDFKSYNEAAYNWLVKIPPQHWARSHFTGRAKSDVLLNNMCEVLNSKLVKGRAMPIIHYLEFIMEYLMIRIVNVGKVIARSKGPLTPTATRMLELIKTDAEAYKAIFNGTDKYQVSGPWGDQCVVNIDNKTCSCRKWEITGMPCKHVVAVNYDMVNNGRQVEVVEAWVDPIYRLDTWKMMYQFTINPITGMSMWAKCPEEWTIIIPPKYHTPIGRPRKKRRKIAEEIQMSKNGKLSRKLRSVVCKRCGTMGHNKRSCKQGGSSQSAGGPSQANSTPSQAAGGSSQANPTPTQAASGPSHTATGPSQSAADPR
uniref:uncharacterized protein LOC122583125 n=1 Tax=Erigeron canadensis TaxID=72917 RepID=UPI001CB9D2AB|nr:uncharacterized protein LOC122583125 [Erigeron canadensis]